MIKRALLFCFILFLFEVSAHASRSLIIDTDVGTDDEVAMLYLLNRHDVTIKAITIASAGEAHCESALKNVKGLLKLVHQENVPVACGRDYPLAGEHRFPGWLRTAADTLSGASALLPKTSSKSSMSAINLLYTTLSNEKSPVDILAIGPLTNLAELFVKYPDIKPKIRMIYAMGGAVNVRGNLLEVDATTKNAVAEWNLYIDPKAADIVFRSGVNVTLVPLDVTNQVPVEMKFYHFVKQHISSAVNQFFYELFHSDEKEIMNHQWYFWDALAAVISSDESVALMVNKKLRIVLSPETQAGATIVDNKNGNNVRVCIGMANKKRFEELLLETIVNRS